MTTSPNVLVYSAIDGWRRQMVERGDALLGDALRLADAVRESIAGIDGVGVMHDELLGEQASYDLDRLQVLIDVAATGTSGYQAADWLREHCRLDVGMSDHRRILATLSSADDAASTQRLLDALQQWRGAAGGFDTPPAVDLPGPEELQLETVMLPRDAFFGPTEMVPATAAAGRICAEQITPYPPGIPAAIPGERLDQTVVDYLRSGLAAGMNLPDPADPSLKKFRVVA